MPELETRLRALAADVAWPPTPDFERALGAYPAAAPARHRRGPFAGRPRRGPLAGRPRKGPLSRRPHRGPLAGRPRALLAAVLAALVLLPAAGAVAFPGARDDVLEWLGLRNVTVRRVPEPPPSTRAGLEDDLGRRVTFAQAVDEAGFTPPLPAALGAPDRVRIVDERITLVYGPRDGLPRLPGLNAGAILTASLGGYLEKFILDDTDVERVEVRGQPGAYISGGDHVYRYLAPGGVIEEDRALLAGRTLIWEQDGLVLRLETAASRAKALQIARSPGR